MNMDMSLSMQIDSNRNHNAWTPSNHIHMDDLVIPPEAYADAYANADTVKRPKPTTRTSADDPTRIYKRNKIEYIEID